MFEWASIPVWVSREMATTWRWRYIRPRASSTRHTAGRSWFPPQPGHCWPITSAEGSRQVQVRDFDEPEALYELAGSETFPALRALPAAIHNLPRSRTSFVGREVELAELRELLADSQLVTLVGAAGSGKTRLARELALRALEDFSDGAWLVELATLSRPDQVLPAIAHALGVREAPGEDLRAALLERLREARLLLSWTTASTSSIPSQTWSMRPWKRAARVHIVATSHERLGRTWRADLERRPHGRSKARKLDRRSR